MSTCSFDLQKQIIKAVLFSGAKDLPSIDGVIKRISSEYNIVKCLSDFDQSGKNTLSNYLFKNGIDPKKVISGKPLPQSKRKVVSKKLNSLSISNFQSSEVTDLFHSMNVAKNFFELETKRLIMEATYIGLPESDTYVKNDEELNANLKSLKNKLFKDIVLFLNSKNLLDNKELFLDENNNFIAPLYKRNGKFQNYDLYKQVINTLDKEFFSNSEKKSYSGKLLPNIQSNISKPSTREIMRIYNSAVLLVNFDNVILKYFPNVINLDYSKFNDFEEDKINKNKYLLRTKGFETPYWLEDNHASEGVHNIEDDLTTNVVSMIPIYDRFGELTPYYLETKDLYSLASLIRNFELKNFNRLTRNNTLGFDAYSDNPEKMFMWYIDNIIEASENGFKDSYNLFSDFKYKVDIIKSLKNFYESIKNKEANSKNSLLSVVRQVLNNSYGAIYSVYNANSGKHMSVEMFSHNSNRIALQNTMYAHFDRYSESATRFKVPQSSSELKDVLESPKSLSKYIHNTLGIYIGELGAERLLKNLYLKNSNNPEIELYSLIKQIELTNVINKVQENELLKQNVETVGEAATHSEVISEFLQSSLVNDILDIALDMSPIRPIMNISKESGESIPTFKLPTLTYSDVDVLKTHLETRIESDRFNSLFTSSDEPVLLGTQTKLEVIKSGKNKDAGKFNEKENFKSDFFYDFLSNILKPTTSEEFKSVGVMIGNYSDKSTILTKAINLDVAINRESLSNIRYIIGNEDGNKVMSVEDVIELTRVQSFSFYSDMFDNIFEQYDILFSGLGRPLLSGNFDQKVSQINAYLQSVNKDQLLKDQKSVWNKNKNIELSEEIHYSSYANGLALNQQLVNFYRITSSNSNFQFFVKSQEKSFADKLTKLYGSNQLFDFDELKSEIVEGEVTKFDQYDKASQFLGLGKLTRKTISDQKGNLHPMLRKWMWVNALFRNEYLFVSTKGEYNHPHKVKGLKFNDNYSIKDGIYYLKNEENEDVIISQLAAFKKEMSGRLSSMAKRNVAFTATIEKPIKNSRQGVTNKVNVAVMQDAIGQIYNYSGNIKNNQDIHDGSSIINYLQSKMIEASYPGKGYRGTKKQFATFITKFGSSVKKDAETVLTNDKIRNSMNSDINLKFKQEQMLSSHDVFFKEKFSFQPSGNNIYWKDGSYYKINSFTIQGNSITLNLAKRSKSGGWILLNPETKSFKNLYNLWTLFGSEYSVNSDLKFNEGSNDLLYELITTYNENGEYILKDKMIHILSNHSAFKSGATRLNTKDLWKTNEPLMYSTFDNKYMGPQLDANHDSDGSEVKEVSQVLSALAQNGYTSHLAEDVYESLAEIIKVSAQPYVDKIHSQQLDDLSKLLSKRFFDNVTKSSNVSLAKSILETFDEGKAIPFSNQNFFQLFVRDIISRMNSEFISRYYSGIAGILNPSHGMIQLFEDENGNVYTQEDIIYDAIEWYNSLPEKENLSSKDIIQSYIQFKFPLKEVSINDINPGDTIIVDNKLVRLNTIETYYNTKEKYRDQFVTKVYNITRDLKPSEITFKVKVELSDGNIINRNVNLFDTDSIRLRYKLNNLMKFYESLKKDKSLSDLDIFSQMNELIQSDEDYIILENFAKFWKVGYLEFNKLNDLLNAWTQRNLQLLDLGKIMTKVSPLTDFSEYFGNDNIVKDIFEDVENHYLSKNSVEIFDYKFKPAELILPNIYKSNFDTQYDNVSKIYREKENYFKNKLNKAFQEDDFKADFKVVLKDENKPIYVRYSTSIPVVKKDNMYKVEYEVINGTLQEVNYRLNEKGEKLYIVPDNAVVTTEDGHDIIYIKVASKKIITSKEDPTTKNDFYVLDRNFSDSVNSFIRSFNGELLSIVPLMNERRPKIYQTKTLKEKGESFEVTTLYDLNEYTANTFNKYSGYNSKLTGPFNNNWFVNNKESIIDKLSKKMYASWQKSTEFVAARIPAQSMQSFMEMKNVGYLNTTSNDAYVSVWQIWLQGSDFDIDKVYLMGYGFNKDSQFETWGNLSDYSSKEQLDELEKLPLPSGFKSEYDSVGIDLSQEIIKFGESYNEDQLELTPKQISIFNDALRKLKKSDKISEYSYKHSDKFLEFINKYNLDTTYQRKRNAVKNSVISKIKQVISSPSNQLLANEPIDVDMWHKAANKALLRKGAPDDLSSWDMISMYKQQRDASVGKEDVGIGANGLKVYFNLTNYFNKWFSENLADDNLNLSNYIFNKSFYFNDENPNIEFKVISDAKISRNQLDKINELFGTNTPVYRVNSALAMSGFVSAATDNAKELLMAKINAIPDLASIHMYMLFLGFTPDQVSEYMNSDLVDFIIKSLESDMFEESKDSFIPMIVENFRQLNSSDPKINEKVDSFLDLYGGGQEFKVLASILKVNQKTSANIKELNKFLNNFETAMFSREHNVFGKDLANVRDLSKIDETVNKIFSKNRNLIDSEKNRNEVKNILKEVNNVKVYYLDENGVERSKNVSLLGGQFDFRYYHYTKNQDYKNASIKYYNLIKNTINMFHVIENSPHFKEMINGVKISHEMLNISSKKYNFVFSKARDIVRKRSLDLHLNSREGINKIKTKFGNQALPVNIDDVTLSRLMVAFDKRLVLSWLKTPSSETSIYPQPSDLVFNVQKLLSVAGLDKITLYTSNSAKSHSQNEKGTEYTKTVYVNDETPFIISLTSDYGIANFKILMEKVIFKILEDSRSNLSNSLRIMKIKNPYGLFTSQIVANFPISQLNSPVNADKFQTLLNDFNDVDRVAKVKIDNTFGKSLKWKDLFFAYNLFVNNESYGDRRLTPIFEDYVKDRNTLGYNYLNHASDVDSGKIDIFDINEEFSILSEGLNDLEKQELHEELELRLENDILFQAFHQNGSLRIKTPDLKLSKKGGVVELLLANSNFIVNTSMEITSSKDRQIYNDTLSFINTLRKGNLIITFNCE